MPKENHRKQRDSESSNQERKLAAILFADIQGYTSLMQSNEQLALSSLQKFKTQLDTQVPNHNGEIINFYGDGCLAIFNSSVDATACAKYLQLAFQTEPKVPVRIGLHAGDVVLRDDNVFGDAVNIASRIESMGVAGSVLLSSTVRNQIKNQEAFGLSPMGKFEFKNVEGAMTVYALTNEGIVIPKKEDLKGKQKELTTKKKNSLLPIMATALIAVLLFSAYYFFSQKDETLQSNSMSENTIAVFPFHVSGSDDIQYLGEGMVDLISTRLGEIPSLKSIDPNLVFSKLGDENAISRKPEKAASLAVLFGASQFILGRIVEIDNQMEITATRYSAAGQKLDSKSVKGNKSQELANTVDELIKQLVAKELEDAGEELGSLAAMTSSNLESLKAYLKGEQAFRDGNYGDAHQFFTQATQLDSTFALAWMRVVDAAAWDLKVDKRPALSKWAEYRHTMPKKWQEYYDANQLYNAADRRAITAYENLIRRYGEHYAFLNGLAEFYFHFNPVYGRPLFEAKPYLEKALALDPQNKEALIHLGHLAVKKNDLIGFQKIMQKVDKDSEVYSNLRGSELLFQDTVTDEEIKDFVNHPQFKKEHLFTVSFLPKDQIRNYDLIARIIAIYPFKELELLSECNRLGFEGKEKASAEIFQELTKVKSAFGSPYDVFQLVMPASLMAAKEFLPHSEQYETFYQFIKGANSPWGVYAAIKYAIALNKEKEVADLKIKLRSLATTPSATIQVKHYDFSIKAFEAKMLDDNDKALVYIDSAFQYSFGYWEMQISSKDKAIMAANIYAEKGEYEKAIPYFENMVLLFGDQMLYGYRLYKLSQWYEQAGNTQKALIKCDLLLESFKDCDEKYRPWVEETKERRKRLMAKEL